jgi:hypothetical protein
MPTSRTRSSTGRGTARRPTTSTGGGQPKVVKWEPVRIVTTAAPAAAPREPLFYIDDREFTIPVEVPPNVSMAYLRDMRNGNAEQALASVFDRLLGPEGLDELAECDSLEPDQLKEIMRVIELKVMAAAEQLQGN